MNNIVIYAHYVPPQPSASATRLLSMARYFRDKGWGVEFISTMSGDNYFDGFKINRVKNRFKLIKWIYSNKIKNYIVSSPPGTPAAEVVIFAKILRKNVLVDVRDPYVSEALANGDMKYGISSMVKKILEKKMLNQASAISFVSENLKELMRDLMQIKYNKPTLIAPNGVDLNIFKYDESVGIKIRGEYGLRDEVVFVYVGILGGKELDKAIKALIPALRQGGKLVVIGVVDNYSAKIKSDLIRLTEFNDVKKNVLWLENLKASAISDVLNMCDIGINTLPKARAYCLPVKTYEYMACGVYNLSYAHKGGALSKLLSDNDIGELCVDWEDFSVRASFLAKNVSFIRKNKLKISSAAEKYSRILSNEVIYKYFSGL